MVPFNPQKYYDYQIATIKDQLANWNFSGAAQTAVQTNSNLGPWGMRVPDDLMDINGYIAKMSPQEQAQYQKLQEANKISQNGPNGMTVTKATVVNNPNLSAQQLANKTIVDYWSGQSEPYSRVMNAINNDPSKIKFIPYGEGFEITTGEHPGWDTLYLQPTGQPNVYSFSTYNQVAAGNISGVLVANPQTGFVAPVLNAAQQFAYTPGSPGGFIRNMASGITSAASSLGPLGTVALAFATSGLSAELGAALGLEGAAATIAGNTILQTTLNGGDVGKALTNSLVSYAGASAGGLASQFASGGELGEFLQKNPSYAATIANTATRAALTGQSMEDAVKAATISVGTDAALNKIDGFSKLDSSVQNTIRNAVSAELQGKDVNLPNLLTNAAISGLTSYALNQSDDFKKLDPKLQSLVTTEITAGLRGKPLDQAAITWAINQGNQAIKDAVSPVKQDEAVINQLLDQKATTGTDSAEVAAGTQQLIDAITNAQTQTDQGTQVADVGRAGDPGSGTYFDSQGRLVVSDTSPTTTLEEILAGPSAESGSLGSASDLPNQTAASESTDAQAEADVYAERQAQIKAEAASNLELLAKQSNFPDAATAERYDWNTFNYVKDLGFPNIDAYNSFGGDLDAYAGYLGFPSADTYKDFSGDISKYATSLGFPSVEAFHRFDGDIDAYTKDLNFKLEGQSAIQRWAIIAKEANFPDYVTYISYGGDHDAYLRSFMSPTAIKRLEFPDVATAREYGYNISAYLSDKRNEVANYFGFPDVATYYKYSGDKAAYLDAQSQAQANTAAEAAITAQTAAKTVLDDQTQKLAQVEADRQAAEKAEADKQAAAKAEAERLAAEKAEAERQAQAAEEARAKAQAEADRQAALAKEQADAEERAKAEELQRLAQEEADRQAKAKEEADAKAEAARQAAEKAEADRQTAEKAEQDRLAAEKAEQNRVAAQAEADRQAQLAKDAADEEERQKALALEQVAKDEAAKHQAEVDRLAAEKAEADRQAAAKAEASAPDVVKQLEDAGLTSADTGAKTEAQATDTGTQTETQVTDTGATQTTDTDATQTQATDTGSQTQETKSEPDVIKQLEDAGLTSADTGATQEDTDTTATDTTTDAGTQATDTGQGTQVADTGDGGQNAGTTLTGDDGSTLTINQDGSISSTDVTDTGPTYSPDKQAAAQETEPVIVVAHDPETNTATVINQQNEVSQVEVQSPVKPGEVIDVPVKQDQTETGNFDPGSGNVTNDSGQNVTQTNTTDTGQGAQTGGQGTDTAQGGVGADIIAGDQGDLGPKREYHADGSYTITFEDGTSAVFNADGTPYVAQNTSTDTTQTGGSGASDTKTQTQDTQTGGQDTGTTLIGDDGSTITIKPDGSVSSTDATDTSSQDTQTGGQGTDTVQNGAGADVVQDDGTTKDIQDIIDTTTGGSLGDESDLPPTDAEEPECAPGFHWNGSMCVADTDVEDQTTTCPEGYIFDLTTQACVPVGTDTGGGNTTPTKPTTPTTPTKPTTPTTPTTPTKPAPSTTSNGLNLAALLALMGSGAQQEQPTQPAVADMSGMVDIEELLANPLQTDYRKRATKPKMAEGGSIDDLLTLLNQKG